MTETTPVKAPTKDIPLEQAVSIVQPHVVRIMMPDSAGTGFLISRSMDATAPTMCGIATAAHVVSHAHAWDEPIRIEHAASGQSVVIRSTERSVFIDEKRDTAVMICNCGTLPLPKALLPIAPKGRFLAVGHAIGWFGFPAVAESTLCFFGGRISAWVQSESAYLVDGVAINGVSGGPVFVTEGDGVVVLGVVSAYIPNRATGESLPGLALVRDVSHFHDLASHGKTFTVPSAGAAEGKK